MYSASDVINNFLYQILDPGRFCGNYLSISLMLMILKA